jgi:hypothetical protein
MYSQRNNSGLWEWRQWRQSCLGAIFARASSSYDCMTGWWRHNGIPITIAQLAGDSPSTREKTQVGRHMKCPLLETDSTKIEMCRKVVKLRSIKVRTSFLEQSHADGRTDMAKLMGAFMQL